jgi:hypothetical protein
MATTTREPTDKMYKYLLDLVAQRGEDMHAFLVAEGITKLEGFPQAVVVARKPSYDECRRLLDKIAPQRSSSYRGRRGGYRRPIYRCTHEDYPCCSCGPDVGR